ALQFVAYAVGYPCRPLRLHVYEYHDSGAIGVRFRIGVDPKLVIRRHAGAARGADQQLHLDRARVGDGALVIARRIGDDNAGGLPGLVFRHQLAEPADPSLFHVAEIDRVVDVTHGVHVAPANRNPLDMGKPSCFLHRASFYNPAWLANRWRMTLLWLVAAPPASLRRSGSSSSPPRSRSA